MGHMDGTIFFFHYKPVERLKAYVYLLLLYYVYILLLYCCVLLLLYYCMDANKDSSVESLFASMH